MWREPQVSLQNEEPVMCTPFPCGARKRKGCMAVLGRQDLQKPGQWDDFSALGIASELVKELLKLTEPVAGSVFWAIFCVDQR